MKYSEWIDGNWCCYGDGFKEYKRAIYFKLFRRNISIAWVWAIDTFGRRCFTPFKTRMNYTAFECRIGYVKLHISKPTIK